MKKAPLISLILVLSLFVFLSSSTFAGESASVTVTLKFKAEPSVASLDLSDEADANWLFDSSTEKSEKKTRPGDDPEEEAKKKGFSNGLTIKDEEQSGRSKESDSKNSLQIYYSDNL